MSKNPISKTLKSKIQAHPQATIILCAFIILGVIYSLVTPPFEAGDESRHYAVVKYMADTGRLPVQKPGQAQVHWSHEGNQPPLYYALAALLTCWLDTGDWNDVFWYNPHTTIGNPLRPDNKNITIHPPGENPLFGRDFTPPPVWPQGRAAVWPNHVLAVHLIRLLSITMATVTVITAYYIALALFKGNRWPAAGAMAITAFNPMFIFISASINNDNAVIMFITLALGVMVSRIRYQVSGVTYHVSRITCQVLNIKFWFFQSEYGLAVLLGLLIGLGALSKLYALGLLPLAALFFLWLAYQRVRRPQTVLHTLRSLIPGFTWILITLAVVLLVAGWFYVRNAVLYQGDFLALQVMRDTAGMRSEAPTLSTLQAEFEGFRIAYWALFGGVNILADSWIYRVLDVVSLIAVMGVVLFIVLRTLAPARNAGVTYFVFDFRPSLSHHLSRFTQYALRNTSHISLPSFTLLLAWFLIMLTGFIGWNFTQPAGQGRLMYPAIAAISALGMGGLTWWLPQRGQTIVAGLVGGGLFIFAAAVPFRYIVPVYAKPPILKPADLPADLTPVNLTYDGKIRLIGYKLQAGAVHPAESLPITLYWQMVEPIDRDYSLFIHLLGRQRQVVGQIDSYPGGGAWPTSLLAPGNILADHYEVPIKPEAEFTAPTRLLIAAGIYDYHEPGRPGKPAFNADGRPVEPIIASAKLVPWQWPLPPASNLSANFFDKANLLRADITPTQQAITLTWQVNQTFEADYTVFIQAWREGKQAAGFDGPPVQGDYPTSLWSPGEIVVDAHPLNLSALPPGEYELRVGLYNPITGERLPAFGPNGPLPDYAVNVGQIKNQE